MRDWFRVEAAAEKGKGGGEILIYGVIGKRWYDEDTVGAKDFVKALKDLIDAGPGDVVVRINSPGGDVADGIAIHNAIRDVRSRVVCRVESVAYSMASVIALAGRTTEMQDTGQFMIHNPSGWAQGGEREFETALKALRSAKAVLTLAYKAKTGASEKDIQAWMEETTWMSAEQAKERGFVDEIVSGESLRGIAACFDVGAWERWYRGQGPMPGDGGGGMEDVEDVEDTHKLVDGGAVPRVGGTRSGLDGGGDAPEAGKQGAGKPPLPNGVDAPKEKVMGLKMGEIKAACEGASSDFIVAQFELCEANEGRTLVDVMKAFQGEQLKALAAANAKAEAAEAEAAAAKAAEKAPPAPPVAGGVKPGIGVKPLGMGGGGSEDEDGGGDPVAAWDAAVENKMKAGLDRVGAIRAVAVKDPELHRAYLAAHNAESGRPAGRFAV